MTAENKTAYLLNWSLISQNIVLSSNMQAVGRGFISLSLDNDDIYKIDEMECVKPIDFLF